MINQSHIGSYRLTHAQKSSHGSQRFTQTHTGSHRLLKVHLPMTSGSHESHHSTALGMLLMLIVLMLQIACSCCHCHPCCGFCCSLPFAAATAARLALETAAFLSLWSSFQAIRAIYDVACFRYAKIYSLLHCFELAGVDKRLTIKFLCWTGNILNSAWVDSEINIHLLTIILWISRHFSKVYRWFSIYAIIILIILSRLLLGCYTSVLRPGSKHATGIRHITNWLHVLLCFFPIFVWKINCKRML